MLPKILKTTLNRLTKPERTFTLHLREAKHAMQFGGTTDTFTDEQDALDALLAARDHPLTVDAILACTDCQGKPTMLPCVERMLEAARATSGVSINSPMFPHSFVQPTGRGTLLEYHNVRAERLLTAVWGRDWRGARVGSLGYPFEVLNPDFEAIEQIINEQDIETTEDLLRWLAAHGTPTKPARR